MTGATITVTDITKAAQSLLSLLSKGSQPGYTVAPAAGFASYSSWSIMGDVSYCSIQSSPSNSATVYKGDEFVATDGSRQCKEMQAGDVDVIQAKDRAVHLGEIYITASANGAKVNVEIHYS
jgi:hypothetical protein